MPRVQVLQNWILVVVTVLRLASGSVEELGLGIRRMFPSSPRADHILEACASALMG
jgi:hypothetical protein